MVQVTHIPLVYRDRPKSPTYNTQTLVSGFSMADVLALFLNNGPGVDGSGI